MRAIKYLILAAVVAASPLAARPCKRDRISRSRAIEYFQDIKRQALEYYWNAEPESNDEAYYLGMAIAMSMSIEYVREAD